MGIYVLFSQLDWELIHSCNRHSLNYALGIVTWVASFNPPFCSVKVFVQTRLCVKALRSMYDIIGPRRTQTQVPWRDALVSSREAVDCLEGGSVFAHSVCTWLGSLYTCKGPQWEGEDGLKCSLPCVPQTMHPGTEQSLAAGRNNFSFTGRHFGLPRATFFPSAQGHCRC